MGRRKFLFAAVLVITLAAALRFHRIESQSFWNDEGNSARLSERSIALIIEGTASDIHPPLYYLLLRGWREILGDSEFGLRSLSAFAGIGMVATTITLGRRLVGPRRYAPALLAGFLVAINPALVYYSQETRMYELLALLALLSTLLLVMWLKAGGGRHFLAAGYVISVTAGLYTHYFFPAVLVTQNLIFLIWLVFPRQSGPGRRQGKPNWSTIARPLSYWFLMMLAVLILYLPWLPIYWRQAGGRQALRVPLLEFLGDGARWSAFGTTLENGAANWILLAYFILGALGAWFGRSRGYKGIRFTSTLLLSVLLPLILMWLLGATRPAFFKFIVVVIPPLSLLAGSGWWWTWRWRSKAVLEQPIRRSLSSEPKTSSTESMKTISRQQLKPSILVRAGCVILGLIVLIGSGWALLNIYYDPVYARADYRGIAAQVEDEDHPNAGIILNAANQWEVFTYYHQAGAPVYPLPRGYPDPATIDAELGQITALHDRVYAIFWGEAERDPQRLVERWLDSNTFKARDEWRGDVRFVTYAVPADQDDLPEIDSGENLALKLGDHIRLERLALLNDSVKPGEIVQLTLDWTTDDTLVNRYKVFLHLSSDDGNILAQRDSEPGGGLALTTTWTPSEHISDNHGLLIPFDTPPGQYTLLIGMYDLGDPLARLPIYSENGQIDAFPLAIITVIGE
jgi:4-amino-4-deoxy-L-arabinose transferase-like glycosyltransferase